MKKRSITIFVLFVFATLFAGCKANVDNSFTVQNISAASVIINFRGQAITVASGGTSVVKEIPNGTYSYSTTYEVPAGTLSSSAQGDLSGSIVIKAGTKILLLFSSNCCLIFKISPW